MSRGIYLQLLFAAILYTIAYVYAIIIAPKVTKCTKDACLAAENIHRQCVVCTGYSMPGRGKNYYIGGNNSPEEMSKCLVTFWGATHFALYFVLGMVAPDLFWPTFVVGVAFEAYEYHAFDCHDAFDIVLNSAGFLAGRAARGSIFNN